MPTQAVTARPAETASGETGMPSSCEDRWRSARQGWWQRGFCSLQAALVVTVAALSTAVWAGELPEASRHDADDRGSHWAYLTPQRQPLPDVSDVSWPRVDLDYDVLAALEAKGLAPVADASPATIVRRLYLDLTGLPPTLEQVEAFVAQPSQEHYEGLVDQLLASPRFGEKWARHWLDVARYAESTGGAVNFTYPHAWRYRDYVIEAFNSGMPWDQFIREQLAGDLLPAGSPQDAARQQIATGFLAIGTRTLNEPSGLQFELDTVDEQINATSLGFLGLTVACARCHDHEYDPIPQRDYYALAGIFRSTQSHYGTTVFVNARRPTPLLRLPEEAVVPDAVAPLPPLAARQMAMQIRNTRDALRTEEDRLRRFLATGRLALLEARRAAWDEDGEPVPWVMGVTDKPVEPPFRRRFARRTFGDYTYGDMTQSIGDSPLYARGESDQAEADLVPRGMLAALVDEPLQIPEDTSGRLQLAEWIASDRNPLTARVVVNRIWLQLFGRGLVATPDDFGMAGQPPSHPALLDRLAVQFVEDGWRVKDLIRSIVRSRTYQLASVMDPVAYAEDPEAVTLWRMPPRRLDAEQIRDRILFVSGHLIVEPPVGSAVARYGEGPVAGRGAQRLLSAVNDPFHRHRSIYLPWLRDNLPEAMELFDVADPSMPRSDRDQTTVPGQGLYLLNSPLVMRSAERLIDLLPDDLSTEQRLEQLYRRVWLRSPTAEERAASVAFLDSFDQAEDAQHAPASREALAAVCQSLFASSEFLYRW